MNDCNFVLYKLPIIDVLYLQAVGDLKASRDLNMWRKAVRGTAFITFRQSNVTSSTSNHDVNSFLDILSLQDTSTLTFSAFFQASTLQLVPTDSLASSDEQLYGARLIGSSRVIFITPSPNVDTIVNFKNSGLGNWLYSFVDASMQSSGIVSAHQEQQLCDALPNEVMAAVSGVVGSTLNKPSSEGCLRLGTLLLSGASGSGGKTFMQRLCRQHDAHLLRVSAASFYAGAQRGGSVTQSWAQKQVREVVLCALSLRRCVLLFEDLHFLTPVASRHVKLTEAEEGVVEAIYQTIHDLRLQQDEDRIGNRSGQGRQLLIVGCAHDEQLVHLTLREAFSDKVHIPLPSARERRRLMRTAWTEHAQKHGEAPGEYPAAKLDTVADSSAGLAVIPLLCACSEAVRAVKAQFTAQTVGAGDVGTGSGGSKRLFAQVAGLEDVKRVLQEAVLWPRQYAHLYRAFTARSQTGGERGLGHEEGGAVAAVGLCAGILLFGPPGTGKTLLPRALSEELGCSLVNLRISDVVRGEIGTSEKRVVQLFQEAKRCAPSVLFIDEFQALFASRAAGEGDSSGGGSLTATLAGCFDDLNVWNRHAGAESLVTVLASTNEPWAVDPGFLRPGRLDKCVFVGPLDCKGRLEFLTHRVINLMEYKESEGNEEEKEGEREKRETQLRMLQIVATATEGFTGADLTLLLSRAQDNFTKREQNVEAGNATKCIEQCDFQEALQRTQASTCSDDILDYTDWISQYPYLQ